MISSRSYHANIIPVSHLECGVGAKCHVLSIVVVGLNTQRFTHRNLTEISDSFYVISQNKQFLHSYDFPPLLGEPDLQWWPRNVCILCHDHQIRKSLFSSPTIHYNWFGFF